MTIIMDQNDGSISATLAGYVGFAFLQFELTTPQSAAYLFRTDKVQIGESNLKGPILPEFQGTLRERRIKYPAICKRLKIDPTTVMQPHGK